MPVLAWLWLRGRCRACRSAISPRYPLVEATTAALCAGVLLSHSSAGAIALGLLAVLVLVPVALIDLAHHVIPNRITGPAAFSRSCWAVDARPLGRASAAASAAAAGGVASSAGARVVSPRGMGMGDVKLAGLLGLLLGSAVAPALLIALVAGVLVGVAMIARAAAGERRGPPACRSGRSSPSAA